MPVIPAAHYRSGKIAGFTLLEILVVVVIIGVVASTLVMSVGGMRLDRGKDEARRFAALVRLAGQEAMLRSRELAVELFADGYRFLVYDQQQWQPLDDEGLAEQHLPEGMSFDVQLDGATTLWTGDTETEAPRIYLLSTGEMTPFDVMLTVDGQDVSYRITGGLAGKLAFSEQH